MLSRKQQNPPNIGRQSKIMQNTENVAKYFETHLFIFGYKDFLFQISLLEMNMKNYFFFYFRMVLKNEARLDGIASMIRGYIPSAKKSRLHGRELSYILPRENVSE